MATLSKADLLKDMFGTEEVEVPGRGGTVRVRPLSRHEALSMQGVEMDAAVQERKLLALALVEPKLSERDVEAWQKAAPAGELEPITQAIVRMSGLEQRATVNEAVKTFRDEPGA
jgi:hypothetical protein